MPRYDFKCNQCNEIFEISLSIKEKETANVVCPKCKSENTSQIFSAPGINTKYSSKESYNGCAQGCCSNCDLASVHNH